MSVAHAENTGKVRCEVLLARELLRRVQWVSTSGCVWATIETRLVATVAAHTNGARRVKKTGAVHGAVPELPMTGKELQEQVAGHLGNGAGAGGG
jgi:hypothetical protein